MPWASSRDTARRWATDRAIDVWAFVAGDLSTEAVAALAPGMHAARSDGAVVVVVRAGPVPRPDESDLADVVVLGDLDPVPTGLFNALVSGGGADVRRLGVVAAAPEIIEAAARAGAGALVGIAPAGPAFRQALVHAQPDVIVEAGEFAGLDAERYGSRRLHRQRVLLNPGPAVVSDRVHRAVAGADLCHREPEYPAMVRRVSSKLRAVAGVDDTWAVNLLAGSGTAAVEAMTGSIVRPGRHLLVCRNGIYGDRIATIAERLRIEHVDVLAPHHLPIDPSAVEAALDADPTIDAIAVVHHETTTGLLNPVAALGRLARERGVLLAVDAISSLGAEQLPLSDRGIDAVAVTSNKCLHGLPGVAALLLSPTATRRAWDVPAHSLYFDVSNYLQAQERSTVPFTPAVPAMYGLEAALDELLDQGVEQRRALYRRRMEVLDAGLDALGLEPIVAGRDRSSSVRSVPLPAGLTYAALHDALRNEGYVIYGGLGDAARTNFRVCAMGALDPDVMGGFVDALGAVIDSAGAVTAGGERRVAEG